MQFVVIDVVFIVLDVVNSVFIANRQRPDQSLIRFGVMMKVVVEKHISHKKSQTNDRDSGCGTLQEEPQTKLFRKES